MNKSGRRVEVSKYFSNYVLSNYSYYCRFLHHDLPPPPIRASYQLRSFAKISNKGPLVAVRLGRAKRTYIRLRDIFQTNDDSWSRGTKFSVKPKSLSFRVAQLFAAGTNKMRQPQGVTDSTVTVSLFLSQSSRGRRGSGTLPGCSRTDPSP